MAFKSHKRAGRVDATRIDGQLLCVCGVSSGSRDFRGGRYASRFRNHLVYIRPSAGSALASISVFAIPRPVRKFATSDSAASRRLNSVRFPCFHYASIMRSGSRYSTNAPVGVKRIQSHNLKYITYASILSPLLPHPSYSCKFGRVESPKQSPNGGAPPLIWYAKYIAVDF